MELVFDEKKSKTMTKEDLCDLIWKRINGIGDGLQMLNVSKVSESTPKNAQRQIKEMCAKACERVKNE